MALDSPILKRVGEKHGSLQSNKAVLDEVEGVLLATFIVPMNVERAVPDVVVPEVIDAGDDSEVTVRLRSGEAIRMAVFDENDAAVDSRTPRIRCGQFRTTISDLSPGGYTVEVTTADGGARVNSQTLVWSDVAVGAMLE